MKNIIFTSLIFFALTAFCFAQNSPTGKNFHNMIDDIKTADEIQTLLKSINQKHIEYFSVNSELKFDDPQCRQFSGKHGVKAWTKADFDNNGYTDLLVMGDYYQPNVFVIMGSSGDIYKIKSLTRSSSFVDCAMAVIENKAGKNIIHYYGNSDNVPPSDLIYKFGDFVEINNSPGKHKIENINYETSQCFGTCPAFKLVINADRSVMYEAIKYNEKTGTFKSIIGKQNYDELTGLLNYINFPNLKDNYSVSWTDDQTSSLTITYDNGKVKKIRDYGLIGTFGLSRVYEILFGLRDD